jgi:guanine deaminase
MGEVRGALLTPIPRGGFEFAEDVTLSWDDRGVLSPVVAGRGPSMEPVLLVPGFIDLHIHLPQFRVRGKFQDALLPWLREHIFPEEARFADPAYRDEVAIEFRDGLLGVGTTSALVFGSSHPETAELILSGLEPLRAFGGDVLMDRNAPEALLRPVESALAGAAAEAAAHPARYALTPRFAPTCSQALLSGCGDLLASSRALLQSHLAENLDEVAWVGDLFPDARSYAEVYAAAGLLGPRCVHAHAVHLDEDDIDLLARTGTWVAHCPTSNEALGSGRMPIERLAAAGVRIGLGTDVGAGPDVSMLDVIDAALRVHVGHARLSPVEALRIGTLHGAEFLSLPCGALMPGLQADIVALRLPGGLRRGESGNAALARVLDSFRGRWSDAVGGVWVGGRRVR